MWSYFGFAGRAPRERINPPPNLNKQARLGVEALEGRDCPSGLWEWNGPVGAASNWSNATGTMWFHTPLGGVRGLAAAGQYPGKAGSLNDEVRFINGGTGPARADVPLVPLLSLQINGWNETLTLDNSDLTVQGGGAFIQADSVLDLKFHDLTLGAGTFGSWTGGAVDGTTGFYRVDGGGLSIAGAPGTLLVEMVVTNGSVSLSGMTRDLTLNGTDNVIRLLDGGSLVLNQTVVAPNTGGIDLGANHTGTATAVVINGTNAWLNRSGTGEVVIAGVVENYKGNLKVEAGSQLKIAASNGAGAGYVQTGANSTLYVTTGGTLTATGKIQVDAGEVDVGVPNGATTVAIQSAGLVFGNANNTFLKLTDTAGGTGTVAFVGDVTLGTKTTTSMTFSKANGTADLLDVRAGSLTLAGKLVLNGDAKPNAMDFFYFFDSSGFFPMIAGSFGTITDTWGTNLTMSGSVVNNLLVDYFKVTW